MQSIKSTASLKPVSLYTFMTLCKMRPLGMRWKMKEHVDRETSLNSEWCPFIGSCHNPQSNQHLKLSWNDSLPMLLEDFLAFPGTENSAARPISLIPKFLWNMVLTRITTASLDDAINMSSTNTAVNIIYINSAYIHPMIK